jgi:hypothetical protein
MFFSERLGKLLLTKELISGTFAHPSLATG